MGHGRVHRGLPGDKMKGRLVLEDGTFFDGLFVSSGSCEGEVVFNTSMTGYQEALTDPSYRGQILAMTFPLVGNYGIHEGSFESGSVQVRGFVVGEACRRPSHRNSKDTLAEFLQRLEVPCLEGVDTRALTIKIRERGVMKGVIVDESVELEEAVKKANGVDYEGVDFVGEVSCGKVREKGEGTRVGLLDCGVKESIVRALVERGCEVVRFPAYTQAEKILSHDLEGFVVSNGPGDPSVLRKIVDCVEEVSSQVPTFGICLGHQLLGMAFGGSTYKLKFGHRGSNQPVRDVDGRCFMTSQNHGYAVRMQLGREVRPTHFNLNDGSVEGLAHLQKPVFSVQFHPEASPGPHDTRHLFDSFLEVVRR